jgi:hypothetical protein
MASLILKLSISLDGYVAPADGSSGWEAAGRSPDGAAWVLDTASNAGAHLVGAVTYARWRDSWPGASGPFAAPMNEIPKVVFSNSLNSADWARRRSRPETWSTRSRVSSRSARANICSRWAASVSLDRSSRPG